MQAPNEPVQHVKFKQPSGVGHSRPKDRRSYISRARAAAAWRRAGVVIEPIFVDEKGSPTSEECASALREDVERDIRELSKGREAHARQTIAAIEASDKSDVAQVEDLLESVYRSHAQGERATELLDTFLDTFEGWLTPEGVAKVDMLFERIDLDRVPESMGTLILATTRLTCGHFQKRDAFIERLATWLVGRSGRTEQDVENMLRGLRA